MKRKKKRHEEKDKERERGVKRGSKDNISWSFELLCINFWWLYFIGFKRFSFNFDEWRIFPALTRRASHTRQPLNGDDEDAQYWKKTNKSGSWQLKKVFKYEIFYITWYFLSKYSSKWHCQNGETPGSNIFSELQVLYQLIS